MEIRRIFLFLVCFIQLMTMIKSEFKEKYGIIRSCHGWALNKLPSLKSFLRENATDYDVDVVYPGGDPVLQILDAYGNEIEKIDIADKSSDQLGQLLEEKGFGKIKY